MLKIGIRVDGSAYIGIGHIVRCMSLAREFRRQGCRVVFITKNEICRQMIEKEEFSLYLLEEENYYEKKGFFYGDVTVLESDAALIEEIVKKEVIDYLVIDHYNVSQHFFSLLRRSGVQIVYIDDINAFDYDVDVVVNGNVSGPMLGYHLDKIKTKYLLGLTYNMINGDFCMEAVNCDEKINEVMITTGGTDKYGLTPLFIKWMRKMDRFASTKINVIIGPGFEEIDEIVAIGCRDEGIQLYTTQQVISERNSAIKLTRMIEVMSKSTIAISTGGSTIYELCAMNTIPIVCIVAENQVALVREMEKIRGVYSLGWYNCLEENRFKHVVEAALEQEIANPVNRQQLVDGKGNKRIVQYLLDQKKGGRT